MWSPLLLGRVLLWLLSIKAPKRGDEIGPVRWPRHRAAVEWINIEGKYCTGFVINHTETRWSDNKWDPTRPPTDWERLVSKQRGGRRVISHEICVRLVQKQICTVPVGRSRREEEETESDRLALKLCRGLIATERWTSRVFTASCLLWSQAAVWACCRQRGRKRPSAVVLLCRAAGPAWLGGEAFSSVFRDSSQTTIELPTCLCAVTEWFHGHDGPDHVWLGVCGETHDSQNSPSIEVKSAGNPPVLPSEANGGSVLKHAFWLFCNSIRKWLDLHFLYTVYMGEETDVQGHH